MAIPSWNFFQRDLNMNDIDVSIVMPVYNTEIFIKTAIESILQQTLRNFEFIIIDDCSTDGTLQVARIYASTDKRIVIVESEKNEGLVKQLNRGVAMARGKYIARMDGDDISHEERIKIQFEFLEKNKDIGLCSTFFRRFGTIDEPVQLPIEDKNIKAGLVFSSTICHASVMARSELMKEMLYEEGFPAAEDYRLWTKLAFRTNFFNIPFYLYGYRHYGTNSSMTTNVSQSKRSAITIIQKEYLRSCGIFISQKEFDFLQKITRLDQSLCIDKFYFRKIKQLRVTFSRSKAYDIKAFNKEFDKYIARHICSTTNLSLGCYTGLLLNMELISHVKFADFLKLFARPIYSSLKTKPRINV